nr:glycosyltransferase [Bacteroidales bacterium]
MSELIKNFSTIELIVWVTFIFLALFQLIYQLISYRKLLFYKPPSSKVIKGRSLPPVSIIICAKNEARNLEQFLPIVLKQDYPEFQVVVVNDCSTDHSEEVLNALSKQHDHLYFTNIKSDPIYRHGKKLAVTLGIKAAKHEHLVFTDADCFPSSEVWLRSIAKNFSDEKNIVIGTSPYTQSKG